MAETSRHRGTFLAATTLLPYHTDLLSLVTPAADLISSNIKNIIRLFSPYFLHQNVFLLTIFCLVGIDESVLKRFDKHPILISNYPPQIMRVLTSISRGTTIRSNKSISFRVDLFASTNLSPSTFYSVYSPGTTIRSNKSISFRVNLFALQRKQR
jgi:hypothetical protein